MIYFSIRHKPSGLFLPETMGYAATHTEPSSFRPPRLFHTKRSAQIALGYWLKGKWERRFSRDWESGVKEERGLEYSPAPERKAEDMEILKMWLTPLEEVEERVEEAALNA